jgi:integrase
MLMEDLWAVLDKTGDSIRDQRDRALLLIGFAGGLRRSELVGLDLTDLEFAREGHVLTLRRSKTDQEGRGRRIGTPRRDRLQVLSGSVQPSGPPARGRGAASRAGCCKRLRVNRIDQ